MAHRGIVQLTHSAALKVAKQPTAPTVHGDNPLQRLTDRELEVLKLVVQGDNNREIAEKLVITAGTVKSHISNILNRLEARGSNASGRYCGSARFAVVISAETTLACDVEDIYFHINWC